MVILQIILLVLSILAWLLGILITVKGHKNLCALLDRKDFKVFTSPTATLSTKNSLFHYFILSIPYILCHSLFLLGLRSNELGSLSLTIVFICFFTAFIPYYIPYMNTYYCILYKDEIYVSDNLVKKVYTYDMVKGIDYWLSDNCYCDIYIIKFDDGKVYYPSGEKYHKEYYASKGYKEFLEYFRKRCGQAGSQDDLFKQMYDEEKSNQDDEQN